MSISKDQGQAFKLKALREHVNNAINGGGSYTDDDVAIAMAEDTYHE